MSSAEKQNADVKLPGQKDFKTCLKSKTKQGNAGQHPDKRGYSDRGYNGDRRYSRARSYNNGGYKRGYESNRNRHEGRGRYSNRGGRGHRGRYYNDQRPEFSDTNIYVSNLPDEWDDKALNEVFSAFGVIESAAIMNSSRGPGCRIAFVNFTEPENATNAIKALHTKQYQSCPDHYGLVVKPAYVKRTYHPSSRSTSGSSYKKRNFEPRTSSHSNSSPYSSSTDTQAPILSSKDQPQPQYNAQSDTKPVTSETKLITSFQNWDATSSRKQIPDLPPPTQPTQPQTSSPRNSLPSPAPSHVAPPPQPVMMYPMSSVPQMPYTQYVVDPQGQQFAVHMMPPQTGQIMPVMVPQHIQNQIPLPLMQVPTVEWMQQQPPMPQLMQQTSESSYMMDPPVVQRNIIYEVPPEQMNPYIINTQVSRAPQAQPGFVHISQEQNRLLPANMNPDQTNAFGHHYDGHNQSVMYEQKQLPLFEYQLKE